MDFKLRGFEGLSDVVPFDRFKKAREAREGKTRAAQTTHEAVERFKTYASEVDSAIDDADWYAVFDRFGLLELLWNSGVIPDAYVKTLQRVRSNVEMNVTYNLKNDRVTPIREDLPDDSPVSIHGVQQKILTLAQQGNYSTAADWVLFAMSLHMFREDAGVLSAVRFFVDNAF